MARALDLSAERQEFIYVAGLLHDVGKLGIPDDILKKAGPLDEEEWRFMKRHPEIAAGMISELSGLSEWREPLLYHHERWDGTGYPTGMAGAGVPFEARIISVCDSYDAMTRRRTYSAPRPHAEAIGELLRCAGTQFDPALVEVFVALDLPDPDSLDLSAAFP